MTYVILLSLNTNLFTLVLRLFVKGAAKKSTIVPISLLAERSSCPKNYEVIVVIRTDTHMKRMNALLRMTFGV